MLSDPFEKDKGHEQTFYQYLKNVLWNNDVETPEGESRLTKASLEFSPNPDLSKGEALLHSRWPVRLRSDDFKTLIGSSQCEKPLSVSFYNYDISNYPILNGDLISGLDAASKSGEFIFHVENCELNRWKEGTVILKFPIKILSPESKYKDLDEVLEQITLSSSVKGIEIVYDNPFYSCYSIENLMDKRNNGRFNNYEALFQFVQKLRVWSHGRSIGLRTGIGDKSNFIELCRSMKAYGVFVDYFTIVGEDPAQPHRPSGPLNNSVANLALEEAVSFVAKVLRKYKLEKEVKIIASGSIDNGFDILKFIALGAHACLNSKPAKYFNQMTDDYFYDEPDLSVKSNVLHSHRNATRETMQLMSYAGFSSIEKVDPRMFFKRVSPSVVKNFEEIYFKNNYMAGKNIFEDFIHLN